MQSGITLNDLHHLFLRAGGKICTDTRNIEPGALFFALKGANFNANEFAAKAVEQGCSFAIVDEVKYATGEKIILVGDTLETLQALANYHRRQFSIPVLAITGSNAKTTNKELIHAVLSKKYNTLATTGNLNNHIGVPLTLLRLTREHEFAIIEMGANHQGEIDALCNIAEPGFGLITNVGKAHLEGFGGIEGVKKGKSELYRFLKPRGGKVFINGDDEALYSLAFENDKITFGCRKLYDVIGKDCTVAETVSLKFSTRYGEKDWNKLPEINTQMTGRYNFINCLAAACVGHFFKVPEPLIKQALESYVPEMNRSQVVKTSRNTILLDAYNANPNSMKAAIDNFANYRAAKKLLLLGDMFELGEYSGPEHGHLIELLKEKGFEEVMLVGQEFYKQQVGNYLKFETTEACLKYLLSAGFNGYVILIKGSRGMKMEKLKEVL